MEGWLKLHRKMLNWKWFSEPNTLAVFIYFLLKANTEDDFCDNIMVKTGELITSRREVAKATGLTEQMVRTAITHLVSTQEITIKSTKQSTKSNSLVTITNYANYQNNFKGSQPRKQPSNQPTNQPTRIISDNIFNIGVEEEKKKENISISNETDIQKNPSLYDNEDFQPEKIKTENDFLMERFIDMQNWLKDTCPTVCRVQRQLTFEQFKSLMSLYTAKEIATVLEKLDEWPDYPKRRSTVYRSALDELKTLYGERTTTMG